MLPITQILTNERLLLSLTGMKVKEFLLLASSFKKILYEDLRQRNRQRPVGTGRKGALKGGESKLFYILFYLKVYPTYNLAGFIFGVDGSRCFRWTYRLLPLLEKALGHRLVLPKRQIRSVDEFMVLCPEVKEFFLEGREHPLQRPQKTNDKRNTP